MTKDLTTGSPFRLILNFTIPLLLGYLFQQFYNVTDTIIVGKNLGVGALASVGSTGAVNFLIIGFVMGVCSGFAIPVAQRFGAKDFSMMRKYVYNSAWLCILISILMTALTLIFCRPLLLIMQTPPDILDGAVSYIGIIFAGIPVIFLYNMTSAVIRSLGDSKTPVYFLVMSAIMNIGLDLLFIVVLKGGVGSAALATVIAQGISGLACLIYMGKKFSVLHGERSERKLNARNCFVLCSAGIPMGLQYSITAVGSVILQTSVNTLGSAAVASITAAQKTGMFFCSVYDALGTAMATYGGQNTGAAKLDRLSRGVIDSMLIASVYAVLVLILYYFAGGFFAGLFVDSAEEGIIKSARIFLIQNASAYILLAAVNIFRFMIQGMGFSMFAVLAGVFEMAARTIMGIWMVPKFGLISAGFASPLAWVFADIFLIPAFIHCKRKLEKTLKKS